MAANARDMADPRLRAMLQPVEGINKPNPSLKRVCFVTIGATAGFRLLLEEVMSPSFQDRLLSLGYTDLIVQCGPDLEFFQTNTAKNRDEMSYQGKRLIIKSFAYTDDIGSIMQLAGPADSQGQSDRRGYGVIISHAGELLTIP